MTDRTDIEAILEDAAHTLRVIQKRGKTDGVDVSSFAKDILHQWGKEVPKQQDSPKSTENRICTMSLGDIQTELGECQRCELSKSRTHIVFGEGNPTARLLFFGEGPGREEDEKGRPFVGRAGQLLDKIIEAMGFTRQDVYICNVVKCRPPNNRNPEEAEIRACMNFGKAQIASVQPEAIVTLGKISSQALLSVTTPISKLRGQFQTYESIPVMPTYHPAYLLRNPSAKRDVWDDMKKVMALLGKAPEER